MTDRLKAKEPNHVEAFCLMKYRDTKGNIEYIWNSRDGVSPFTVISRQGYIATHVEWENDEYLPDYKPPVSSRVFADTTLEIARRIAAAQVNRVWDTPDRNWLIREEDTTKEAAIAFFSELYARNPGQPVTLTVDEDGSYVLGPYIEPKDPNK